VLSGIGHAAFAVLLVFFAGNTIHAQDQYNPENGGAAYVAKINEINPSLTKKQVSGLASFIVADDQVYITIIVKGLSPSMMHHCLKL
jgi:hypothetical protein